MQPQLIDADDKHRAPNVPLRPRELGRLIAFLKPYRGTMIVGLVCTLAFAGLHTMSISGAFPVFKILLEREGLRGWVDRTVAGARLGVEFAPLASPEADRATVLRSTGSGETLQKEDELLHPKGRPVAELFAALADAPGEARLKAIVQRGVQRMAVELSVDALSPELRLLRWAGSLLPVESPRNKMRTLTYVLIGLILATVAANAFRYFGEVLIARSILRGMIDLRAALYERVLHLPMAYFAGQESAHIVTRIVQDIQEIQRGLLTLFGKFIREPLRAALILAWAFLLDWRITLTMTLAVPVAVAIFWRVGRAVKNANRKLLQVYGTMIGALTASLHNLGVVKTYTAEEQERERLRKVDLSMYRQQLRLAQLQAFVSPMMEVLAVVAGSFAIVWLLGRVLDQQMSLSRFVTLGVALSVLFDPLRKLSDVWVRVQRATAGSERIFQVIDQPVESDSVRDAVEVEPLREKIEYLGVTFTYRGATRPALRNVDLTIHKGETVALVGPNGSGKTTLISMLPRLYDPDEGAVLYDGIDIRRASLASLRRQISLVSQEAIVFAGTPAENISYGSRNSENGRVELAARRAYADEFIDALPGGYQGMLGERGTTLSGGQRQRLAIARAVYRDAPILIFDEATSQIDSESEQKIQQTLREFAKGRTTIIVAHRLSTIQFADRIIVMDAGRIADSGSHAELFARCPIYRSLCETQFVGEADAGHRTA